MVQNALVPEIIIEHSAIMSLK